MGLAKFFPSDNPEQCLCAQIYGERTYKDLGYLEEIEYTCTEQKAALRKRAEVMKNTAFLMFLERLLTKIES